MIRFAVTTTIVAWAAGCVGSDGQVLMMAERPLVWPPAPDAPRVRLVGEIRSGRSDRPTKSLGQVLDELLHGPAPGWGLTTPHAVAVHPDGERVAVADTQGGCIHLFDLKRGTHEGIAAIGSRRFECPSAVAWAGPTLFAADAKLRLIAAVRGPGAGQSFGDAEVSRPAGLAWCASNDLLYVSDAGAHGILAFERDGRLVVRFGSRGAGPGQFNFPAQIAWGPDGTLAVADSLNFRIQRFEPDGSFVGMFGRKGDAPGDLSLPKGVAFDPEGNLWVVDSHFENVQAFTPDGRLLMTIGSEGRGPGQFWLPAGIFIDARRRMWVADSYNRRVQVFELLS